VLLGCGALRRSNLYGHGVWWVEDSLAPTAGFMQLCQGVWGEVSGARRRARCCSCPRRGAVAQRAAWCYWHPDDVGAADLPASPPAATPVRKTVTHWKDIKI
jgi:hypothetical protein